MADEKKPEKKDAPPATSGDPFAEIVSTLLALFFLVYILNGFFSFINSNRILSQGWKGLTPQGILLSHTRPINSLLNPVGTRVVSTKDTNVYDSPGGKQIGSQKFNSRGKIIQGPVIIGGERYWYVDYDSGPDGWVKESDIAYLESEPSFFERVLINIFSMVWFLKLLSVVLSILFILFMAYLIRRLTRLRLNERALLYPEVISSESAEINPKWQKILDHIESLNENDWRLAIIESDIMLDDLLDKLSLQGETIGDKLKTVEKSDFVTIDNAWEAHKIRNQIAHEGSEFGLTQREARRVIELYRSVFEEFQII
jgi:hypothetical protein